MKMIAKNLFHELKEFNGFKPNYRMRDHIVKYVSCFAKRAPVTPLTH